MAKTSQHDESQKTAAELLEARVDAMMDVNADGISDPKPTTLTTAPPLLPGKASKSITIKHDDAEATAVEPKPKEVPKTAPETITEPVDEITPLIEDSSPTLEEPAQDDVVVGETNIDTPESDAAIDDIVAQEADEVLAAEDAGLAVAAAEADTIEPPKKHGHPVFWFFVLLLVILAVLSAVVLVNPNLSPSFAP